MKRYTAELVVTDQKTQTERHYFYAEDSVKELKRRLYKVTFLDFFGEEVKALLDWMHSQHIKSVKRKK